MVPRHDESSYLTALAAVGSSLDQAGEEHRAARDDGPSPHELVRRQRRDQLLGDVDGLDP